MELENDFTEQYFKQYMDMLKQPNELDAYAEGSYNAAKATDPKYAASQQVLSGVASGFKAAANKQRQEKLSPMIEQAGQLYQAEAMLRSQKQEFEARDIKVKNFFQQNAVNISNFSKANQAGDTEAINNIGSTLVRSYKQIFNDNTIGGYSHTHDGEIYYENLKTGKIEGISLASLISQLGLSEALWGDDALKVMSGLSSGAKEKYQNTQELQRQQLAMGQANIDDKRSHTNLQNMQAGEIGRKMNQQPEVISSEDAVTQETINLQKEAIKDIYQSRVSDSFYKSSMKTAEDILKKAQKNSSKYERNLFSRAFDKEGDNIRLNEQQERLHTVGAEIKGAMFKRFGYRNKEEFKNLPEISPNKTVKQNIAALKVIQDTYKEMVKGEENAISSFNKLIESQHTPEDSANLTTDKTTSKTPEFVQDENGNIYRIED